MKQQSIYLPGFLALIGLLLLNTGTARAAVFSGEITPGVDVTPGGAGDFNEDGKTDLVSFSQSTNKIILSLGDGSAGFSSSQSYSTGSLPDQIRVADINNDSHQDVIVVNQGVNQVSVLLGDGAGNLGVSGSFGVGSIPQSLAVGDLDNDGNMDIVSANAVSNNFSVLLGDGAGGFASTVNYSTGVGTAPVAIEIKEVTGDANLDVVVANRDSGNVMIFAGNGTGTFAASTSFAVGVDLSHLILADLNSDGLLDMVLSKLFSNGFSVLMANSAGNYGLPVNYMSGASVLTVAVTDLNGDGKIDVVASAKDTASADGVNLFAGDNSGFFGSPVEIIHSGRVPFVFLDINSDGLQDVVLSAVDGFVSLMAESAGVFIDTIDNVPAPEHIVAADFNNDGNADFITSGFSGVNTNASLITSDVSGKASLSATIPLGVFTVDSMASDFDGDGNQDLFVVTQFNNTISLFSGDGTGGLSLSDTIDAGSSPVSIDIGDVNNDGLLDLVSANIGGNVAVMTAKAGGGFDPTTTFAVQSGPQSAIFADLDEDGNLDIVAANSGSDNISVLMGDGSGGFSAAVNVGVGIYPTDLLADDFNRDGHMDIAVSNTNSNTISVLLGAGSGGFSSLVNYPVGFSPGKIRSIDGNADGNVDLLVVNVFGGAIAMFPGDGAGNFSAVSVFIGKTTPGNIVDFALADINHNGRSDIISADSISQQLTITKNIQKRPGAVNDVLLTEKNTSVTSADVLLNDVDAESSGSLVIDSVDSLSLHGGSVVNNMDNTFTYTPATDFVGNDDFRYTIIDGSGATASALVAVDVRLPNNPPVPVAPAISTSEDSLGASQINANDPDIGDRASYSITTSPVDGIALVSPSGLVSYTPNANFNGSDSLVVTVTDKFSASSTVVININVLPINDSPVIAAADITINEDQNGISQVNVTDPDAGDTFTYSVTTPAVNGITSIDANGLITFAPDADYNGFDTIIVQVKDSAGAAASAVITVNVNSVNDAPEATASNISTTSGGAVQTQIMVTDVDAGDTASYAITGVNIHGSAAITAGGVLSYTADPEFSGTDTIDVTVTDSANASDVVTVQITVAAGAGSGSSVPAPATPPASGGGGSGSFGAGFLIFSYLLLMSGFRTFGSSPNREGCLIEEK